MYQKEYYRKNNLQKPNYYKEEEQNKILQFIVKEKAFEELKGNILWKKMESAKIIPRSWQSMKQNFKVAILPNLENYTIISEADKKRILNGYMSIRTRRGVRPSKLHEASTSGYDIRQFFKTQKTETNAVELTIIRPSDVEVIDLTKSSDDEFETVENPEWFIHQINKIVP